jgi:hypothetical protein
MIQTAKRAFGFFAMAACTWALSSSAAAQTGCQGTVGPDVIVGDITGPANYGATGTLEALSLGTTSCNQGTTTLGWHSNTNQHPVIGGELYRWKMINGAGHFDQLGLSWLKHGFFAESQQLCCSGCQATDGTVLGVRCSDPYTGDRNGTQSLCGPRYQVNPNTGFFTYPPPHPSGGNTGRIQVDVSQLDASGSGTRYFGNAQYIAPDDAMAGHGNNNASYREIVVNGSGTNWSFGFSGSTHREIPAIRAWATCEAGVTTNDVTVTGEGGLLILGYKATNLGNGQYHYEYALYNMNSDKGVGTFSIPVAANVSVTNVGFNDVTYRGGDGIGGVTYDGTDWPSTNAGGSLTWATTPFASNPNANAIRWGTTYTFRFDANAAPTTGTISIVTFKSTLNLSTTGDVPGGTVTAGTPFCFGDGSLAMMCPCFNLGNPGNGCANSANSAGANLASAGTAVPDTVVFTATGETPTALSIILQGDAQAPNGVVFGDGVRCVNGTLKRLYIKTASGGAYSAPQGGDPSVTARSAALGDPILPGSTRYYQSYYRDANPTFCTAPAGGTFNVSNAIAITW